MKSEAPVGPQHVYRIDKFIVPAAAREAFTGSVHATHELLRTCPGFVRDLVLEQTAGPGDFNLVTLVEWDSAESLENAKVVVAAVHRRSGLDVRAELEDLGVAGGPRLLPGSRRLRLMAPERDIRTDGHGRRSRSRRGRNARADALEGVAHQGWV